MGEPRSKPHDENADPPTREKGFWVLSYEGWIAVFTLVLTLATIWLGISTRRLWKLTETAILNSQADAVNQADRFKRQLAVARAGVVATRRATRARHLELRPYVYLEVAEATFHEFRMPKKGQDPSTYHTPTGQGVEIEVRFKNYGATPAIAVSIKGTIRLLNDGSDQVLDRITDFEQMGVPEDMPPGKELARSLKRKEIFDRYTAFADGKWPLYFIGEAVYTDKFDEEHTTRFCVFCTYDGGPKMQPYKDGNEATSRRRGPAAEPA